MPTETWHVTNVAQLAEIHLPTHTIAQDLMKTNHDLPAALPPKVGFASSLCMGCCTLRPFIALRSPRARCLFTYSANLKPLRLSSL